MKLISVDAVVSPVSTSDFKNAIAHDFAFDDAFLADQLCAATEMVEAATNRPALMREVEFMLDVAAFETWWFPCAPVSSITLLSVLDNNGVWQDVADSNYSLMAGFDEPRLQMADGFSWPDRATGSAIRVRANVGFETSAKVPKRLRQAVILMTSEWFREMRHSGDDPNEGGKRLSFGVRNLMRAVKYHRPIICR